MTACLLALVGMLAIWPVVGCHHHDHEEKRSVTIETPNQKTEVEVKHEKD
jgi:hypothetical protein